MSDDPHITQGTPFTLDGERWEVLARLDTDKVIAHRKGSRPRVVAVEELARGLKGAKPAAAEQVRTRLRDLTAYSLDDWEVAQARLTLIDGLLRLPDRKRRDVETVARLAGVNPATIYDWLRAYLDGGERASALVPRKRGRRPGTLMLDARVETVVAEAIRSEYLDEQRKSVQKAVDRARQACAQAGLPRPSPGAVRTRVALLDPAMALRRRGRRDEARDRLQPIRGAFPDPGHALGVVQVDHTLADVEVVDDVDRAPIGRVWITLAIDVHTRMVVGLHVSLEPPSYASVGMCLYRAMARKEAYLAELGVPGAWPVHGRIGALHTDNAKEFRGERLKAACTEYRVDLKLRPVKRPHYGGHIERLMKTSGDEIHTLPGTTFSNPRERKGYDSEAKAAMTTREFEAYLVDWVVNVYNAKPHRQIGVSPLRKWEVAVVGDDRAPGIGTERIEDEAKLRLDLLPYERRAVRREGVVIDRMHYWDEVLRPWVRAKGGAKHVFRFDPDLMNVLHFWDPEAEAYYDIPFRDLGRPPITRRAIREANAALLAEGRTHYDERAVFETIDRLAARREEAVAKSKAARRDAQRERDAASRAAKRTVASPQALAKAPADPPSRRAATPDVDDLFAEPARPYDVRGSLRAETAIRGSDE